MRKSYFATVTREEADIAWMIYDLSMDGIQGQYRLTHQHTVYTEFRAALERITTTEAGSVEQFIDYLQKSLNQKRIDTRVDENNPADAPMLVDPEDV